MENNPQNLLEEFSHNVASEGVREDQAYTPNHEAVYSPPPEASQLDVNGLLEAISDDEVAEVLDQHAADKLPISPLPPSPLSSDHMPSGQVLTQHPPSGLNRPSPTHSESGLSTTSRRDRPLVPWPEDVYRDRDYWSQPPNYNRGAKRTRELADSANKRPRPAEAAGAPPRGWRSPTRLTPVGSTPVHTPTNSRDPRGSGHRRGPLEQLRSALNGPAHIPLYTDRDIRHSSRDYSRQGSRRDTFTSPSRSYRQHYHRHDSDGRNSAFSSRPAHYKDHYISPSVASTPVRDERPYTPNGELGYRQLHTHRSLFDHGIGVMRSSSSTPTSGDVGRRRTDYWSDTGSYHHRDPRLQRERHSSGASRAAPRSAPGDTAHPLNTNVQTPGAPVAAAGVLGAVAAAHSTTPAAAPPQPVHTTPAAAPPQTAAAPAQPGAAPAQPGANITHTGPHTIQQQPTDNQADSQANGDTGTAQNTAQEQPAVAVTGNPSLIDEVEKPKKDPLDEEGPEVKENLRSLIDAIYKFPMSKVKTAELYKSLPRPKNLDVLHKTRINELVEGKLDPRGKARDKTLESVQWGLQFAARPLVQLLQHVDSDESVNKRLIIQRVVDTLKLTARASSKLNRVRKSNLKQNLKGAAKSLVSEDDYRGFQYLLGDNFKEELQKRKKLEEVVDECVVSSSYKGYNKSTTNRGNGKRGRSRGRSHNGNSNKHQQSYSNNKRHNRNNSSNSSHQSSHKHKRGGSKNNHQRRKEHRQD